MSVFILETDAVTSAADSLSSIESSLESLSSSVSGYDTSQSGGDSFDFDGAKSVIAENIKAGVEILGVEGTYQGKTYEAGDYESLVIYIGEAKGDNWWCVLFPNFCLTDINEDTEYKSYFKELLNKIF